MCLLSPIPKVATAVTAARRPRRARDSMPGLSNLVLLRWPSILRIFSNEEFYQLRRKYFYKLILDEKMGLGEEWLPQ
jgi:hypothetical protein